MANRFDMLSDEEISELIKGATPVNIKIVQKSNWALRTFNLWQEEWKKNPVQLVVNKELHEMSPSDLNFALKHFVFQIKRLNGENYPAESIKGLVTSLFHHIRTVLNRPWIFLKITVFMMLDKL